MINPADLPDDIDALKALLLASEGRNLRKQGRIDQLEKLVADFKRALFGAKSEKVNPVENQLFQSVSLVETAGRSSFNIGCECFGNQININLGLLIASV